MGKGLVSLTVIDRKKDGHEGSILIGGVEMSSFLFSDTKMVKAPCNTHAECTAKLSTKTLKTKKKGMTSESTTKIISSN